MMVDLFFGFVCALMWLPLVTGYCAYSYGRSFWLWFGLGCGLPIVSFFVLLGLICREQFSPGHKLVEEAKRILAEAEAAEVERHL
ncbi:hypothetical protein F0P96_16045 [Hymenobacter busanensis]|uniref:Uncharacterized protein n=1 Tax=Hymenobacter busanensis TaxID=2607656 RepID=A0A7L4ZS96_9BACT|nr:hypothetical protein [Hymenobacter busanensis]KAA9327493.1 hypothetical protein F0P96_16045 [Hymenobacter busanensis]QHJ06169.1 hypothetical protein GUY19_02190 [Hymenobacter busanensis]